MPALQVHNIKEVEERRRKVEPAECVRSDLVANKIYKINMVFTITRLIYKLN